MAVITTIEGVGATYASMLKEVNVDTTDALLEKGATPAGRRDLAETTGISPALILKWVNHVDLMRIKGVGEEYADLLEAAGVDTVVELAMRNPQSLHTRMGEVNAMQHRVRQLPGLSMVEDWIRQARLLPRVIQY